MGFSMVVYHLMDVIIQTCLLIALAKLFAAGENLLVKSSSAHVYRYLRYDTSHGACCQRDATTSVHE